MNTIGESKNWTDEQWSRVQQTVHDEARRARIAGRFLPLFGPLPGNVATVPAQLIEIRDNRHAPSPSDVKKRLAIDDTKILPLVTVAANVFLTSTQQSDPDLSSAFTLFMRAANLIARIEDAIIFRGAGWKESVENLVSALGATPISEVVDVSPFSLDGIGTLLTPGGSESTPLSLELGKEKNRGQGLVEIAAKGISELDAHGFQGPYALVLSQDLFVDAETPDEGSLVLPSDRIKPLIEGPLLRSTILPKNEGVLISLAGNPVEIVVASDINVRFLQLTTDPLHVYRVSEKFVLRIKEPKAIVTLKVLKTAADYAAEAQKSRKAAVTYHENAASVSKAAAGYGAKAKKARDSADNYDAKAKKVRDS